MEEKLRAALREVFRYYYSIHNAPGMDDYHYGRCDGGLDAVRLICNRTLGPAELEEILIEVMGEKK